MIDARSEDGGAGPSGADLGVVLEIRIRSATGTDIEVIAALTEEFEVEIAGERGGDVWLRLHRRPPPLGASIALTINAAEKHVGCAFVATIDDVVVGWASARTLEMADGKSHQVAEITDLMVTAAARGVGVGRLLLDAVVTWSVAQECDGIDAVALPGARATKNFFEAAHFTARAIVVHHRLRSTPRSGSAGSGPAVAGIDAGVIS